MEPVGEFFFGLVRYNGAIKIFLVKLKSITALLVSKPPLLNGRMVTKQHRRKKTCKNSTKQIE